MPILFIFSPGHILGVWSLVNPDTSRWFRRENQVAVMTAFPVQKGASPLKKVSDLRVKVVFGKGAKVPRDLFYEAFSSSLFSLFLYLTSHLLVATVLQRRKKAGKPSRKQDFLANKACLASNSTPSSPSYPFSLLSALVTSLRRQSAYTNMHS